MNTRNPLILGIRNMVYGNVSSRESLSKYLKWIPVICGIVSHRRYHDRGQEKDRQVSGGNLIEGDAMLVIPHDRGDGPLYSLWIF
jgi:hypothetical protein